MIAGLFGESSVFVPLWKNLWGLTAQLPAVVGGVVEMGFGLCKCGVCG